MFVQSVEFIRAHANGNGNGGMAKDGISIYGQESNYTTWRLAKMNPPAELSIPPSPLGYKLRDIPVSVPSTLLERRPDIAGRSHWCHHCPLLSRRQPVWHVRFHGDRSARALARQ
jgi:hypothetical protein